MPRLCLSAAVSSNGLPALQRAVMGDVRRGKKIEGPCQMADCRWGEINSGEAGYTLYWTVSGVIRRVEGVPYMATVVVFGILLSTNRVLLVKRATSRAFYPGVWDFPGGHSEHGEAPEQTLIRELAEELGVVPTEYRALPVHPLDDQGLLVHGYWVKRWTGTPGNLQEHEHSEMAWVRLTEVDKLELASPAIPELLQSIQK